MGSVRTTDTRATTSRGRQGQTMASQQGSTRWHLVGAQNRRTLVRLARQIPTVPDLPPSLPYVGTLRCLGRDTASASPRPRGERQDRPFGVFHRRHLCGGEKRGDCVGKTKRGKGTKVMVVADATGLPLALHVASASPHEVTLVEDTLASRFTVSTPKKLIGDKAYDSDPLDQTLQTQGIEMISPHRVNRRKPKTQDGRKLRRYKRRWKVERLIGWLQNYRRVLVRYERHACNFLGFVKLACMSLLLRAFMR